MYLEDFTKEELNRINQLYGNDFKGITPDDAYLIGRWERAKTEAEVLANEQVKAIHDELEAKREVCAAQVDESRQRLANLVEEAKARYEVSCNG